MRGTAAAADAAAAAVEQRQADAVSRARGNDSLLGVASAPRGREAPCILGGVE